MGRLENLENLPLTRDGDNWKLAGAEKLNTARVQGMLAALGRLKIVGVRPKPPNMTSDLKQGGIQLSVETMMSLRQKGFFLTPDGRLLSNEGEVLVETNDGMVYTLRFGEILTGQGESKEAAKDAKSTAKAEGGESRYLFVTAGPARDATETGQRLARELSNRFADWYYVISGADFSKLRLRRKDLVR